MCQPDWHCDLSEELVEYTCWCVQVDFESEHGMNFLKCKINETTYLSCVCQKLCPRYGKFGQQITIYIHNAIGRS